MLSDMVCKVVTDCAAQSFRVDTLPVQPLLRRVLHLKRLLLKSVDCFRPATLRVTNERIFDIYSFLIRRLQTG